MSEHPYGQSGAMPGGQQPTGPQPQQMMPQGDPNAYQQYQQQQQYPQQQQYQPAVPAAPSAPLFSHPWLSKLAIVFGIIAGVGLLMLLSVLGSGEFMMYLGTVGSQFLEKGLLGLVLTLVLQGVWVLVDRNREDKQN